MEKMRKSVLRAMIFNIVLLLSMWVLLFGSAWDNMERLAEVAFGLTCAALPLLFVAYVVWRTKAGRFFSVLGLSVFVLACVTQASGFYYKFFGVWQPEFYTNMAAAKVTSVSLGWDNIELEPTDAKRVVDLMQQISYRNPSIWLESTKDLAPDANADSRFVVNLADGRKKMLAVYPAFYIVDPEFAYRAAEPEVCQALYDLYAELSEKYVLADDGAQLAAE